NWFATINALVRRQPLPRTSATSSLSPSADGPWRSSFSRGRSLIESSFITISVSSQQSAVGSRQSAVHRILFSRGLHLALSHLRSWRLRTSDRALELIADNC